jgi:hypothetical protein
VERVISALTPQLRRVLEGARRDGRRPLVGDGIHVGRCGVRLRVLGLLEWGSWTITPAGIAALDEPDGKAEPQRAEPRTNVCVSLVADDLAFLDGLRLRNESRASCLRRVLRAAKGAP